MSERIAIGIDLGGTYIKAGLVNESGTSLGNWKVPTISEKGTQQVLESMLSAARVILDSDEYKKCGKHLAGIGIGTPGIVNNREGYVCWGADNIPGWKGVKIKAAFEQEFKTDIYVNNDASAFIWGEYLFGAGKGHNIKNAIGYTLGTGVGGGTIVNGHLFLGSRGYAAEPGHTVVTDSDDAPPCNCGCSGCLEVYAGGNNIVKYVIEQKDKYPDSLIFKLAENSKVSPRLIHEAALEDDPLAIHVIDRMGKYLGLSVSSQILAFDPDIIIMGGGVASMGEMLFSRINEAAKKNVYYWPVRMPEIVHAQLGYDAGFMGAAGLALFPEGV